MHNTETTTGVTGVELEPAVRTAIARRIADGDVPDHIVGDIVERLGHIGDIVRIRGLDICAYGICLDHFVETDDLPDHLARLFELGLPLRRLELFPWGIPTDDLVQIRAEHVFEELVPFTRGIGG